jgi:hypothetical protein
MRLEVVIQEEDEDISPEIAQRLEFLRQNESKHPPGMYVYKVFSCRIAFDFFYNSQRENPKFFTAIYLRFVGSKINNTVFSYFH